MHQKNNQEWTQMKVSKIARRDSLPRGLPCLKNARKRENENYLTTIILKLAQILIRLETLSISRWSKRIRTSKKRQKCKKSLRKRSSKNQIREIPKVALNLTSACHHLEVVVPPSTWTVSNLWTYVDLLQMYTKNLIQIFYLFNPIISTPSTNNTT